MVRIKLFYQVICPACKSINQVQCTMLKWISAYYCSYCKQKISKQEMKKSETKEISINKSSIELNTLSQIFF